MHRFWIAFGSLAGLTAVAMAAVTAHRLSDRLDASAQQMVRSAVQMQGWHALALVLCGVWALRGGPAILDGAGAAFAIGLLFFCGSIYLLILAGVRLPWIAPVGGMLLMAGWALLGIAAFRAG